MWLFSMWLQNNKMIPNSSKAADAEQAHMVLLLSDVIQYLVLVRSWIFSWTTIYESTTRNTKTPASELFPG